MSGRVSLGSSRKLGSASALNESDIAPSTRSISAGTGLTGGGSLASDRTIGLDTASIASLALADTAVQPADIGTAAARDDDYFTAASFLSSVASASARTTTGKLEDNFNLFDIIPSAQHNAISSGSSSYDIAGDLENAITSAAGTPIHLHNGVYPLSTLEFTVPTNGLRLIGDGSKIQGISETARMLQINGAYDATFPITSFAETDLVYDSANNASRVATFDVTGTPGWEPGDVIKIWSDDELDNAQPFSVGKVRKAEFCIVLSCVGSTVTTTSTLYDTYTTSPQAARVQDRPFSMSGLRLDQSTAAFESTSSTTLMRIRGLIRPQVFDVEVERLRAAAVQFVGNYQPFSSNIRGGRLSGNTVDGQFGYLVDIIANHQGVHISPRGHFMRHVVTTNQFPTEDAANDFTKATFSGRERHTRVFGGSGMGCFNSPFDVHEGSYDVGFIGCSTSKTVEGRESQGSGYNFRSQSCWAVDCVSDDDQVGVSVFESYAGSTTGGAVTLTNVKVRNAKRKALVSTRYFGGVNTGESVKGIRVEGGEYHAKGEEALRCEYTTIEAIGAKFTADTGNAIFLGVDTNAVLRDVEAIGVSGRAIAAQSGALSLTLDGGRYEGFGDGAVYFAGLPVTFKRPPALVMKGATNGAGVLTLGATTTVKAPRGFDADFSAATGTNIRIVRATGDAVSVAVKGIRALRGSASYLGVWDGGSFTGHGSLQFRDVDLDGNGNTNTDLFNIAGTSIPRVQRRASDKSTARIQITYTVAAPTPSIADLSYIDDDELTIRTVLDGSSQAYTMADWPAGRDGQKLNIVVSQTGGIGNTLALAHSGTTRRQNKGGSTLTLAANNFDSAQYVYDGVNWREL